MSKVYTAVNAIAFSAQHNGYWLKNYMDMLFARLVEDFTAIVYC